jgi:hypothetical protein
MVILSASRPFALAIAAALLAACATGQDLARPASAEPAAFVRAVPAAQDNAFTDDDADAFWDSIGDPSQTNLGFVETLP